MAKNKNENKNKYRTQNPATENIVERFEITEEKELERTIKKSYEKSQEWKEKSFDHRAKFLYNIAELLLKREEKLANLMTKEMGKPITSSRSEIQKCAWVCEHYASYASSYLSDKSVPTDAKKSVVKYEPLGPVLAIMPWNFPLWQVFRFAAPNLMAGNTGILKHASNVPQCAKAIENLFREAGFPEGVFQNIYPTNDQVSQIIQDKRIKGVTLTGSDRAGSIVAGIAGENLKKTVLELGGSDPFIVLDDANIPKACDIGTKSRLLNSGQSCVAAKRFILHEDIADEFINILIERFKSKRVGDPTKKEVEIGPLARKDLLNNLEEQVEESVKNGAKVLIGAEKLDRPGYFYKPTIIKDPEEGTPAYEEELFGPVATIITVENERKAIELANHTSYGLGASIWTQNIERAERLVPKIEAGNVFVNELVKSDPRLPFGGVKRSGYGRELGEEGIKEFVNRKTVYID